MLDLKPAEKYVTMNQLGYQDEFAAMDIQKYKLDRQATAKVDIPGFSSKMHN